jgi:NADPH:quinone reductase-like Zn-dependent oxidoreductase
MEIKAAICRATHVPVGIESIDIDRPLGREVLVRTVATGVCHSDLHVVDGAGALDGVRIREAILKMDLNTVFGPFKVDQDGFQVARKWLMFQWQNGRKVILWPEELAPGRPRFPTPPWSQRQ